MDKRVVSADPLQGMQIARIASGFVERFSPRGGGRDRGQIQQI